VEDDWWVLILAMILAVLFFPPYAYVVFKFAGAGWMAGIFSYIKSRPGEG
jgi:hypothetical protein